MCIAPRPDFCKNAERARWGKIYGTVQEVGPHPLSDQRFLVYFLTFTEVQSLLQELTNTAIRCLNPTKCANLRLSSNFASHNEHSYHGIFVLPSVSLTYSSPVHVLEVQQLVMYNTESKK